jgi:hypothetical protein
VLSADPTKTLIAFWFSLKFEIPLLTGLLDPERLTNFLDVTLVHSSKWLVLFLEASSLEPTEATMIKGLFII